MIKEIKIFNRFAMDDFASNKGLNFPYNYWYLISIYSEKEYLTNETRSIVKNFGCKDGISLNFWDITDKYEPDKKRSSNSPNAILFSRFQAREIIDFIDKIQKDTNNTALVVHCEAGISRSGAVGTFACDYCGIDYNSFMKMNPYIMSNPYVLRELRLEAGIMPSFEQHDGVDHNISSDIIIKF